MSSKFLLEVKDLSCHRNFRLVFKGLSFKLQERSIVIINGKNGSGKTSLLLCIAGVLRYQGEIKIKFNYFNGIGYVGHLNALNELDTVINFLKHWKSVYNFKGDLSNIMSYFNLNKNLDIPINFLSYGQKKILSFARLLMVNSKIWLLDEPISGLDNQAELLILNLIKKHCESGGGVISTSHQIINFKKQKLIVRVNIG